MLELEKKLLLSQSEYRKLLSLNESNVPSFIHINHYYDTDDLAMNRLAITCRIREKDGKYTATMKNHRVGICEGSHEKSMVVRDEYDDSLFSERNLRRQGSLCTERTILYADHGIEVVLDSNQYLGHQDYELEIEYIPERSELAEFIFHLLMEVLRLSSVNSDMSDFHMRTKNTRSKSERFFQKLESLKR